MELETAKLQLASDVDGINKGTSGKTNAKQTLGDAYLSLLDLSESALPKAQFDTLQQAYRDFEANASPQNINKLADAAAKSIDAAMKSGQLTKQQRSALEGMRTEIAAVTAGTANVGVNVAHVGVNATDIGAGATDIGNDETGVVEYHSVDQVGPYANIQDSPYVGSAKKFTKAQKAKIIEQNRMKNNGIVKSDLSGKVLSKPQKSQKGTKPNPDEWQIDHIDPRSKGGSNSFSNAQVLSREENRDKWDK